MVNKVHILLIDDNPNDRLLAMRELRREFPALEVTQIIDMDQFRGVLAQGAFDLVVTDYGLRWTTGLDVLGAVRERWPDCPVIMFTGTGSEEIAVEAMKAGLDDYVLKSPRHFKRLPAAARLALERARQRRQLVATEARYQRLFNGAPIGLYQTLPDGRFLDANPTLVDILGFPDRATLLAANVIDLYVDPADEKRWLTLIDRTGMVRNYEVRFRRYDGRIIWVRENTRVVRGPDGAPRYYEGSFEDVTERKQAEESLRHTQERLQFLLEMSPTVIYAIDPEKTPHPTFLSSNIAALLGYDARECLATPNWWEDNLHPDDRDRVLGELPGSIYETGRRTHEYRFRHKNGAYRWIRDEVRLVRDAHGTPTEIVGAWIDITERKIAEEEIRRRTAHLETLNAIIIAVTTTTDLQQVLEVALGKILESLGASIGGIWILGAHALQGLPETFGRESARVGSHLAETVVVSDWEERADDGEHAQVAALMHRYGIRATLTTPIQGEGQRIGGLSVASAAPRSWSEEEIALVEAVGRQIGMAAERLRLLDRIREQAQLLQLIMNTAPDGIVLLDEERRIALANPAAREHLALLAGAQEREVLTHLGDRPIDELLQPLASGASHEIRLDSHPARVFEVTAQPLENSVSAVGWVLDLRDVTHNREVQQQMEQQARLAAVGQLAAGIAHDFNNVLGAIILFTHTLLHDAGLSDQGKERVSMIRQASERAAKLVAQILDFSRKSVMQRSDLDLLPFLKETVKLLQRTLPENIEVELHHAGEDFTLSADPTRLQQALMNLAVNARDAMPYGGTLRIQLSRLHLEPGAPTPVPDMQPGAWIRLEVSDTGDGIPDDAIPHIFEPFFTTKAVDKGTGLGLAQVYGIVKQHEGEITFTSELGKGTTFSIYLPALRHRPPSYETPVPEFLPRGEETVLVVEDNAPFREALHDVLEMNGYRVLEASNGREGLEAYNEQVDLVVSDLVMPEMSGTELYRRLKARHPDVKMVILTGYPIDERGQQSIEQGSLAWLQKPVTVQDIVHKVRETLDG